MPRPKVHVHCNYLFCIHDYKTQFIISNLAYGCCELGFCLIWNVIKFNLISKICSKLNTRSYGILVNK